MLKAQGATDQELYNRARGLLLLGAIFKSTVPDESDEERRELERYVQTLFRSCYNPFAYGGGNLKDGRRGRKTEKKAGSTERGDAGRAESRARNAQRAQSRCDGDDVSWWFHGPTAPSCCSCTSLYCLDVLKINLVVSLSVIHPISRISGPFTMLLSPPTPPPLFFSSPSLDPPPLFATADRERERSMVAHVPI